MFSRTRRVSRQARQARQLVTLGTLFHRHLDKKGVASRDVSRFKRGPNISNFVVAQNPLSLPLFWSGTSHPAHREEDMAEETPDPITPELRDAFSDAIGQYEEWRRGESEPVVSLNRLPIPISDVCALVSKFEDRIPDDDWDHLGIVTPGGEYLPNDRSYRSAARYLAHLIKERKAQFEAG